MKILYLYVKFKDGEGKPCPYRGFEEWSLNFSIDRHFYFKAGKILEKKLDYPVPPTFWNDEGRVYNVTALVGDNGVGKTTILHYLIELLYGLSVDNSNISMTSKDAEDKLRRNEVYLLVEKDEEIYQIEYNPVRYENWKSCSSEVLDWKTGKSLNVKPSEILLSLKPIYVSNTLSYSDYEMTNRIRRDDYGVLYSGRKRSLRNDYIYNCSAVSWLKFYKETTNEQRDNYFEYESYKQIKYVFDRKQQKILGELKKEGYNVPYPKHLKICFINGALDGLRNFQKKTVTELFPSTYQYLENCMQNIKPGVNEREFSELKIQILIYQICYHCVWNSIRTAALYTIGEESEGEIYQKIFDKIVSQEAKIIDNPAFVPEEFKNVIQMLKNQGPCSAFEQFDLACEFIDYICEKEETQYSHIEKFIPPEQIHLRYFRGKYEMSVQEFYIDTRNETENEHLFIEFLKKYRYQCEPYYFLNFSWGLSSGENSLLTLFANLYYLYDEDYANHPDEDYAIYNMRGHVNGDREKIKCASLLLLLDEADLTYHPEWQRQFLAILTAILPRMFPKQCIGDIQIILTTHSPLMLGDMPSQSVIYFRKKQDDNDAEKYRVYVDKGNKIQTFGQNLYTILNNGFALEQGAIGELARRKIKSIFNELEETKELLTKENLNKETISKKYKNFINHKKNTVALLAEGIVKNRLTEEIDILMEELNKRLFKIDPEKRQNRIQQLREELKRLEGES